MKRISLIVALSLVIAATALKTHSQEYYSAGEQGGHNGGDSVNAQAGNASKC